MKTQIGEVITGNFMENTITIEIDGAIELTPGKYALVPMVEYERKMRQEAWKEGYKQGHENGFNEGAEAAANEISAKL